MSQALYRKYRSRSLDEILGQDHVTNILKRALEKGRVAHAYLLTGPRGTGKTSVARILAHEINKLPYDEETTHLDIIEIDAASNNGVDDIRSLREKAQVAPVSANKKIYIIDEVHMLSKPAFNALLKTLEEPPAHVVFILATTDADKLPSTILSRVQQYYFRPISTPTITKQLMNIAEQEGFLIDEAAARMIAEHSKGGFRDSISLLDQLSSLADDKQPISQEQVSSTLGLSDESAIEQLIEAFTTNDSGTIIETMSQLEENGADPLIITRQLLSKIRSKLAKNPGYTELIQKLIEVTKHPHPDLKLLTVLLENSNSKNTTKQIVPEVTTKKTSPEKKPRPTKQKAKVEPEAETELTPEPDVESTQNSETLETFDGEFDWQEFLNATRARSMGLYSLLAKCDYECAGSTLTLFAGPAFAKKKLDDAKNRPLLSSAIQKSQGGDINIIIKGGKKPLKNDKLAAVAAMMGGGEEVKLEEVS